MPTLINADLPLPLFIRGKVRDSYDLGNRLLIIATDRISAFDVVLPVGIPDKGSVLNQLSAFWFAKTEHIVANHLIEVVNEVHSLDSYLPAESRFSYPPYLAGRSMVVNKVERMPIECVVRGYLSGSAWAEYQQHGPVAGLPLPRGLQYSPELPRPPCHPTPQAPPPSRQTGPPVSVCHRAIMAAHSLVENCLPFSSSKTTVSPSPIRFKRASPSRSIPD